MAHHGGTPRPLAKCGSAVEVLDKQQIGDPALARVKRARTTGHTDSLSAMAPHSSRHDRALAQGGTVFGIIRPCRHRLGSELGAAWQADLCGGGLALRDDHGQAGRLGTNYDPPVVAAP